MTRLDTSFDLRGLFVLDLANNHQGFVDHGLRIVSECGRVAAENGVRAALKLQLRQLDTFVHPAHKAGSANRHVPRFLSTALSRGDVERLVEAVRDAGMVTMATPFDEESVELIEALGIDVVKVASCSATDWPLLERIATQNRPVVVSTGGLAIDAIDDIVSFLDHRRVHFALMHCVSIYPTPIEDLQLNQIEVLRGRYRNTVIGFSTHECPDETGAVMVAVAKGAEILERHVGIRTETISLNAYSSTPGQIDRWIKSALRAKTMCGAASRLPAKAEELESLGSLQRGIFVRETIAAGTPIGRTDVYFAMPLSPGGLSSGQWVEGMSATVDLPKDSPLTQDLVSIPAPRATLVLVDAVHTVKAMLNEARISLPTDFRLEFSHHYGIPRFHEVGAILIDCVNREYCKKLIVQLPGQRHPNHYHKRKEETFQVLSGLMEVEIEGRRRTLHPGDTLVVPQGAWHSFWTETGLVFEEISSTHYNDDSFYEDKRINAVPKRERKTIVSQWGRYQL
ncbi:MAG: N-acetylneuraminate synthase family protein [Vicinamibacterales bacterium]